MTPLEVVFCVALVVLLLCLTLRPDWRSAVHVLLALAVVAGAAAMVRGWPRWQLFPAMLILALTFAFALRARRAGPIGRLSGAVLGILAVGLSVSLAAAFPVFALPAPDGVHRVGTRSFHLPVPDGRELYLQAWYPADGVQEDALPRTFWREMYRGPQNGFTFFTRYLSHIRTHSHEDATVAPGAQFPLLLFSHGLALFAEQNTPLMEHLASHGFVVLAVGHSGLSMRVVGSDGRATELDFPRIKAALDEYGRVDEEEVERLAALQPTPLERAAFQLRIREQTPLMNALMAQWVRDLQFVLDALHGNAGLPTELDGLLASTDMRRLGMFGMSFGKIDTRCRAGVNIDGAVFGSHVLEARRAPFLTVISPSNEKYHQHDLLVSTYSSHNVVIEGAEHGDLLDISFALPVLKWFGINGSIEAMRATSLLNEVVRAFFEAQLAVGAPAVVRIPEHPELRVTVTAGNVQPVTVAE
jgi:hypothetical protein